MVFDNSIKNNRGKPAEDQKFDSLPKELRGGLERRSSEPREFGSAKFRFGELIAPEGSLEERSKGVQGKA
jgi:hypothetical protein